MGNEVMWKRMYRAAAVAALIMIGLVLLDMGISMALPEGDINPAELAAADWFGRFNASGLYALRDYGVFNMLNVILGIPVLLCLYHLHRGRNQPLALLAVAVSLLGGGIYLAGNTALPMLSLSHAYAAAETQVQRQIIEAAGTALLARGADFTAGSLIGMLLPALGSLLMAVVVLTGKVFKKTVGYIGIIAYLSLSVFTVMTVCWPELFGIAMIIAMPGGLLVLVWNIVLTRKFIKLSIL